MRRKLALISAAVVAAVQSFAAESPIAFVGAHILPIDGPPIENGTLIIKGGVIQAVQSGTEKLPADAQRVDASGKWIIPGLVDTHNHIGGIGGADGSSPLQPDVRVYDSLNPLDAGFRRAVAGGLTTLNIMPGSGHLLSGQTIYVHLRKDAHSIEQFAWHDADGKILGGLKMANGTNSRGNPPFPGTRGKSAALVRELYVKALEYRDKLARAGGDAEKLPPRDLGMEALGEVLAGTRVVHHHTHRADDIMTVLRLSKEFGFRVVLHHVSEAWKVADEIAAAKAPCSVILIDSPGGKLEAAELSYETGAVLEKAGVLVAFHTDDWITDSRLFLRMGALAVRGGMSRAGALRALTINGAKMLDLDQKIGSLTPGKSADLVVLSGDPFSVYTKVEQTWVEGQRVFDRSNADDLLHAVGGYGAGHDQKPYFCCFDHDTHVDGE